MTEKYGIPVWASFVIFGAIVVLLGLLLGMVSDAFKVGTALALSSAYSK